MSKPYVPYGTYDRPPSSNSVRTYWRSMSVPSTSPPLRRVPETCDKLLENPYFTQGWHLPAFYPFYSYQCMASIDSFFDTNLSLYPNKQDFWNKQSVIAKTMFAAWEPTYYIVCSTKRTPFPKCLWYHKYQYVHIRKQPQAWSSFFQNSPFSTWGRIMPGDRLP